MLMVALRMRSEDSEGRPDFAGNSREYRDRLAEVFRRTNMPDDERKRISSAGRRAAGDIVREVLTSEELEDYGLMKAGPSERVREARKGMWVPAEVQKVVRTTPATDANADVLRLTQGALGILSRISDEAIGGLTDVERDTMAVLAGRIEDRAYELRMKATPDDEDA
ncbi:MULTISPECIES: hypothetical protein [unclassified Streptomyces]|uniref:hypothetical protein n=1 Tax=unclassified Streptomyces TaxID=2593676 RepID=UPI0035E123D3